jgi:hypothetical protein
MTKSVGKEVAESWEDTNKNHNVRRFTQNRPNRKGQVKIEIEVLLYVYGGSVQYHRERKLIDTTIWVRKGKWNNKTQNLSKKEDDYIEEFCKIALG